MPIETSNITAVLLADGWHQIKPGSFEETAFVIGEPGRYDDILGPREGIGPGFTFSEVDGREVSGPMTSVLAVRH